jgi:TPR repeat protein
VITWLEKCVEKKYPLAYASLGTIYSRRALNQECPDPLVEDASYFKAASYYEQGALFGDPDSALMLGICYINQEKVLR